MYRLRLAFPSITRECVCTDRKKEQEKKKENREKERKESGKKKKERKRVRKKETGKRASELPAKGKKLNHSLHQVQITPTGRRSPWLAEPIIFLATEPGQCGWIWEDFVTPTQPARNLPPACQELCWVFVCPAQHNAKPARIQGGNKRAIVSQPKTREPARAFQVANIAACFSSPLCLG